VGDTQQRQASPTYLVEHYWPGVAVETFCAAVERVRSASEALDRGGSRIRYLHSTIVPADEAAYCVFRADSAELIEQVYARAGVRFDRLVDALEIAIGPGMGSSRSARRALR
jgi:hypothetical protein